MYSRLTDNVNEAKKILLNKTPTNKIYDVFDTGNFVEFTTDTGVYRVHKNGMVTER